MKNGFVHIDWVISFGIFVVFLLLLFIWYGPSLTETYDNEYLKAIARQGFERETYVKVIECPIYVEARTTPEDQVFSVKLPSNKNLGETSRLSLLDNNSRQINNKKIDSGFLYFRDLNHERNMVKKYILYYSEGFNITSDISGLIGGAGDYSITLGVCNEYFGFSDLKFDKLSELDYEEFKDKLKYPSNRDIAIFIYDADEGDDFKELVYSYNMTQPFENQDVYIIGGYIRFVNQTGAMGSQVGVMKYLLTSIRTW